MLTLPAEGVWVGCKHEYRLVCGQVVCRYEHMFNLPVARAMFQHICCADDNSSSNQQTRQNVSAMAAEFASWQRQRASQVTAAQHQAMYVQLAAEIDALPSIFLRQRDGKRVALVAEAHETCSRLKGQSHGLV